MKEKPAVEVRLNKRLWAARLRKTRALVHEMIEGDKVHYNGQCSKPSRIVEPNAMFTLRQGNDEHTVIVKTITEQCRPASEAALLYEETAESIEKREKMALAHKLNALTMPCPDRRPDKKKRRDLLRLKHGDSEQLSPAREMIMPQHDQLHRYLSESFVVRGKLVTVSETLQQILENHDYPQPVKNVLVELLVVASLLTTILRLDGDITVQLQDDGPMNLAVINGNNDQQIRGVVRVQGETLENAGLKTLIGNGCVVITITPSEDERYQGVAGLEGDTLVAYLKNYFMCSEQLPTHLFIHTSGIDGKPAAGGMLLQVMFVQNAQQDSLDHPATPTETIKTEELLTLPANEVLWRLYHEEEVTAYDPQDVELKCICSREHCADALEMLPDEEIDSILAEDGEIDTHCDYCGNHYPFNAMDIAEIRNNAPPADLQVH